MARRADLLEHLCSRVVTIREQIGDEWPYHADPKQGNVTTTGNGDWCDGHWIDCLRMVGELKCRDELITEARQRTEWSRYKLEKDDMFRGHRFYYSAAKLWITTADKDMRTLALAAAYALRSMAMPVNGAMPVGHEVQVNNTSSDELSRHHVCVDNVHPNLILDWWAYRETGDSVFIDGARRHLDLTIKDFIRADGSTIEFIEYDPDTGEIVREYTLLGAHDASCWSRGQAWAIAGFLRAWEETREARYLDAGRRLFDYWWARSDEYGIPPYDFLDPDLSTAPPDTSASTIVIEQLARLAVLKQTDAGINDLIDRLEIMLEGVCVHTTPIGPDDERPVGMIVDGCFNQPKQFANRHELIWSLSYTLTALYWLERGTAF